MNDHSPPLGHIPLVTFPSYMKIESQQINVTTSHPPREQSGGALDLSNFSSYLQLRFNFTVSLLSQRPSFTYRHVWRDLSLWISFDLNRCKLGTFFAQPCIAKGNHEQNIQITASIKKLNYRTIYYEPSQQIHYQKIYYHLALLLLSTAYWK